VDGLQRERQLPDPDEERDEHRVDGLGEEQVGDPFVLPMTRRPSATTGGIKLLSSNTICATASRGDRAHRDADVRLLQGEDVADPSPVIATVCPRL
jgi:hypothetical protein